MADPPDGVKRRPHRVPDDDVNPGEMPRTLEHHLAGTTGTHPDQARRRRRCHVNAKTQLPGMANDEVIDGRHATRGNGEKDSSSSPSEIRAKHSSH